MFLVRRVSQTNGKDERAIRLNGGEVVHVVEWNVDIEVKVKVDI